MNDDSKTTAMLPQPWDAINGALAVRRHWIRECAAEIGQPEEVVAKIYLWAAIGSWQRNPANEQALLDVAALASLAWSLRKENATQTPRGG